MSLFNAASSSGNIIGPLLFKPRDAPAYHPGLKAVLGIFIALVVVVLTQLFILKRLNITQQKRRVANGKVAVIHDHSMEARYVGIEEDNELGEGPRIGEAAFLDLTDRENDEFTYIY
jgi:hypothetical protein